MYDKKYYGDIMTKVSKIKCKKEITNMITIMSILTGKSINEVRQAIIDLLSDKTKVKN